MKKVLCFGTFDILHEGHKEFLKDAKGYGDFLIVNVISDNLVYENKKRYPVNKQDERIRNLVKLGIADKIIKVSDNLEDNHEIICSIKPDVILFGYDQKSEFLNRLKEFLSSRNINPEYKVSKEFAGGIHSSHLN